MDDGLLRRQCPFCQRQFKVRVPESELDGLVDEILQGYLAEQSDDQAEDDKGTDSGLADRVFCPYCGQDAPDDEWWTDEQIAYFTTIAKNIMASLINESFIGPLKRSSRRSRGGLISVEFKADEIPHQNEWIAPETDDMRRLDLPCCECIIKIEEDWSGTVHCVQCGFPHRGLLDTAPA